MLSVLDSALAGLARGGQGIQTAAHNIANVNTDGFRSARNDSARPRAAGEAAEVVVESDGAAHEAAPSDVDLARERVNLKRHAFGYRANAAVIRMADRTTGDLLDLLG